VSAQIVFVEKTKVLSILRPQLSRFVFIFMKINTNHCNLCLFLQKKENALFIFLLFAFLIALL